MKPTSASVEFWENVWLPRVRAAVCWPCNCAQLTPAGKAKVDRTVAGIKALGLVSQVKFKPNRIEILDRSDGTRLSMSLTSPARTRRR